MILSNKQITKALISILSMRRLVCAFVVRKPQNTGFPMLRPILYVPKSHMLAQFIIQEKIDMLRTLGADVRPCPVVPWSDDNNYNHQVILRLHYIEITLH